MTVIQDEADPSSKYNYTNVLMTKATDMVYYTAPTGTNLVWMDSDRDAAINAYTIDGATFTVQTDQSTADGVLASDLLGASTSKGYIDIVDDNIGFHFHHLLCKLDVTYSWGTELNNATNKTIKSVKYQGFGTDITLDRATCSVTNGTTTADITALVGNNFSEAIFAPQMGETPKVVITATIDGVDRVFSVGVKAPTGDFTSGYRYTMNVTIGGTSVEDESVTATVANEWVTGDANGEAEGETGNMATN